MATDTSKRLLGLLSMLQTPREMPGSELAQRLGVSPRTIRRDIDSLRSLGYTVQASMGATGGYRLVAGATLPPLLLDDGEAVAIGVSLRFALGRALDGMGESSVRALAKLEQILPSSLHGRVESLDAATRLPTSGHKGSVDAVILTTLASAAAARERLHFGYVSDNGTETEHLVEPERLVQMDRCWYFLAYDPGFGWRTFRVERITNPSTTAVRFVPRHFEPIDVAAHVSECMDHEVPSPYRVDVVLQTPRERVAPKFDDMAVTLEELDDDSCRLRVEVYYLEQLAFRISTLGCDFEIHEPQELLAYLREMAERVLRVSVGSERG